MTLRDQLIKRFGLTPHPEGGYYCETFRSAVEVNRATVGAALGAPQNLSASTAIYYLLSGNDHSAWHRIASDETWHFYAGDPLTIHMIDAHGAAGVHRLGNPLQATGLADHLTFQATVPAQWWFAVGREDGPFGFSLVGCTVSPGFEFSEFELADAAVLTAQYPQCAELIKRFA